MFGKYKQGQIYTWIRLILQTEASSLYLRHQNTFSMQYFLHMFILGKKSGSLPYQLKELQQICRCFLMGSKTPRYCSIHLCYQSSPSIFARQDCFASKNLDKPSIHILMDIRSAEKRNNINNKQLTHINFNNYNVVTVHGAEK